MIKLSGFIPVKKSLIFSTAADWQTSVEINILMGERPRAKDNWNLGTLRFDGIVSAPKGVPQIEVTFDMDVNDILSVTAKDLATGKEASIKLLHALNIASKAVECARREAEIHAQEDYKLSELLEARHQVSSILYEAHEQLTELGKKVQTTDQDWIEGVIRNLQESMRSSPSSLGISSVI
ncbi:MAG: Hsp70 family protein [Microcoleus sp. SIO2G3]|nr:Hsp70 family protein [Microcoleus sp. SIO2G3]